MLTLRTTLPSPFGRKARMAAEVAGLTDRLQVVGADTNDPADSLRSQNPLGKIPTLVLEDGEALFDSRVIVEYFNHLAPHAGLLPEGARRIEVLRRQALADGLMDAALLVVYEARFRPAEHHVQSWLDHQHGKISRALAYAESHYAAPRAGSPDAGEIAQAAALGYLDFRLQGAWRAGHPALVAWLDDFAARTPAFNNTRPA